MHPIAIIGRLPVNLMATALAPLIIPKLLLFGRNAHWKRSAPKRSYTIFWVGDKRFQSWKRASEFVASLNPTRHDTSPGVQNAAMAPSPFAHSIMGCYQQFIAVDVAVPRKDHVANNTCLGVAAVDLHRLRKANIDLQRIRTIRGLLKSMIKHTTLVLPHP